MGRAAALLLALALVPVIVGCAGRSPRAPEEPAAPPPNASPPARSHGFGVSDGADIVGEHDAERIRELDSMKQMGATWTRFDFAWVALEPERGSFRFWKLARPVREAQARGLSVVAMLGYSPRWANGGHDNKYPPSDPRDYGTFAGKVAAHFAPLGVHVYELWNEPNTATFFQPSPDPKLYAEMVRAAYPEIKRADPSATVLAGALAPFGRHDDADCNGVGDEGKNSSGMNPVDFLAQLYADGAGDSFDAVSVHPYASMGLTAPCSAWTQLERTRPSVRSVMGANGDRAKQVWATEFGVSVDWADGDEQLIADRIQNAMALWKTYPWAGPLLVFNLWDVHGARFGLLRADWTRRPAWFAFRRVAGRAS
jgi:hypothetical protein